MSNTNKIPHMICENPDCPHAFHEIEPIMGLLLSSLGHIIVNLSAPADNLSPAQLSEELQVQADTARKEGVSEYADKLDEFISGIELDEAKPTVDECSVDPHGTTMLAEYPESEEDKQLRQESYKVDIEYRKAQTEETLAKARLLNAQAYKLERKQPVQVTGQVNTNQVG